MLNENVGASQWGGLLLAIVEVDSMQVCGYVDVEILAVILL